MVTVVIGTLTRLPIAAPDVFGGKDRSGTPRIPLNVSHRRAGRVLEEQTNDHQQGEPLFRGTDRLRRGGVGGSPRHHVVAIESIAVFGIEPQRRALDPIPVEEPKVP